MFASFELKLTVTALAGILTLTGGTKWSQDAQQATRTRAGFWWNFKGWTGLGWSSTLFAWQRSCYSWWLWSLTGRSNPPSPTPGECLSLLLFLDFRLQINSRVREASLKEFPIPLIFKICPTPGFHQRALEAAGYEGVKSFFTGLVNIGNRSVLGWAGNSTNPESRSKLSEFLKTIIISVEDLVDTVELVTMENEHKIIKLDRLQLRKINYPRNCFTLDFSRDSHVNESGIKSLKINFRMQSNFSAEVQVVDKNMWTERTINSHSFSSSGDRVVTKAGFLSSYFVNAAIEEDFTANCTSYPNTNFANYSQCDDEYVTNEDM